MALGSLPKFAAIEVTRPDRQRLFVSGALRQQIDYLLSV
jgi:hypothetical protein